MPAVPVKVDVGLDGVVTVPPEPLTIVQAPVPVVAVLAANVIVFVEHTCWSGPALAVVGNGLTVTVTWSVTLQPLYEAVIV